MNDAMLYFARGFAALGLVAGIAALGMLLAALVRDCSPSSEIDEPEGDE